MRNGDLGRSNDIELTSGFINSNRMKTTPDQFELMVTYLEQHDAVLKPGYKPQIQSILQWTELTDLLNEKSKAIGGAPRSVEKWKKVLADFKNNTKKKILKLRRNQCNTELSDLERRLLRLIEHGRCQKRKATESDDDDTMEVNKQEMDPDSYQRPSSSLSRYLCEASETTRRRQPSVSSCASTSSSSQPTAENRKKRSKNNIKDLTDRYLEFEREREKMAHDREMARMKQNDQLITLFGRIVNVLENVSPSLQRYLDRSANGA